MKNKFFFLNLILIFFLMPNSLFAKNSNQETIILAGGCFWGVEELFSNFAGVYATEVGYAGGDTDQPTYQSVSSGLTNHAESVKISFDNKKTSLEKILKFFFAIHDPTQLNRQQNDIGTQYRSAIFYQNNEQKIIALDLINKINNLKVFDKKIATEVVEFKNFYPAEKYHQNYLQKNPNGYNCHYYRDLGKQFHDL